MLTQISYHGKVYLLIQVVVLSAPAREFQFKNKHLITFLQRVADLVWPEDRVITDDVV